MKANEFIKKYGIEYATKVVRNQPQKDGQMFRPYDNKYSTSFFGKKVVSVFFLKRLVESHELIEQFKCRKNSGISNAKDHLLTLAHMDDYEKLNKLRQAILDVESCQ